MAPQNIPAPLQKVKRPREPGAVSPRHIARAYCTVIAMCMPSATCGRQ